MIKKAALFILSLTLLSSAAFADAEQDIFAKARKNFEQKKFAEAVELYNQIPTKSDRWLLAVEERAWANMHLDQYNKALSDAQTLTTPALNALTGTEPYLMKTLIFLRICDYSAVFQTLKEYKTLKRNQVEAIQQLAKTGSNAVSRTTLEKWMQNPTDWRPLGSALGLMPQLFYHDVVMLREAQKKNLPALESRLRQLAVEENNENYRILQKLNLIEVESVQRVHVASNFDKKQGEQVERSKYDLVFKDDILTKNAHKDVWLDEAGSYQALVNRCQKKSGRTM